MGTELFALELAGGAAERRYRKLRPELESLPWGSLAAKSYAPAIQRAARAFWTKAAFQEYRTGAACAATLQALLHARAPLDLIALATRFATDEMIHVELCARLAAELGGGAELAYDPECLVEAFGEPNDDPLLRASHLVVAVYCVGEAFSVPLLAGSRRASQEPLVEAALAQVVRDEADHGAFGWFFLDWAVPQLGPEDLAALGRTAQRAIEGLEAQWADLRPGPRSGTLGWLEVEDYICLAQRSLAKQVLAPLKRYGLLR